MREFRLGERVFVKPNLYISADWCKWLDFNRSYLIIEVTENFLQLQTNIGPYFYPREQCYKAATYVKDL